ncbi:Gfo/Idh/MocA family protein [Sanguibacter sp. Z1732]|uniref:Gfo/Idh/MocA family protein n=1 Tax=Sanguibacter sp. Z1732 TaxID=3435412 RepID=UPI003D9CAEE3
MSQTENAAADQQTRKGAPLRVVLVGAGHRTMLYARYAKEEPDKMTVVAVVDPDPGRRARAAEEHDIPKARLYRQIADLPTAKDLADAAINGTMDSIHVATTIELLHKGYDVLLEKPIATNAEDLAELHQVADETGRRVQVCHVLRHAPFYHAIKQAVHAGSIGQVINAQLAENVSYDHMSVSYVRGTYAEASRAGSSMLLAKSSHDLDLMAWLLSGNRPVRATSSGNRMFFVPEQAPEGAGQRCVVDCAIESSCAYSAKRHYVDNGWWSFYAWQSLEGETLDPSREQMLESLRIDNPYGRCVWHAEADIVDHQVVAVEFEDGATGSLSMIGNAARSSRTIHLIGTKGELFGTMQDGNFTLREIVNTGRSGAEHQQGDRRRRRGAHARRGRSPARRGLRQRAAR